MENPRHSIQFRSSVLAFALLTPAFLQIQSCDRGDTNLLSLQLEVGGQDEIQNFETNVRDYAVAIPGGSTATLTVQTRAPNANSTYQWLVGGQNVEAGTIGVGGGQVTLTVPEDGSILKINVWAAEGGNDAYLVHVNPNGLVTTPELLATWGGLINNAFSAQVAIVPNGDAVAVWNEFDFDSGGTYVYASQRTSGVWGAPERLDPGNTGDVSWQPQVAVDPNGNAVAVWHQTPPGNVYANRLTSGAWSGAELVETNNNGPARYPQVAVDPNGDAVVVWQQHEGSQRNIHANRLVSGVWGVPELLETITGAPGGYQSAGWAEDPQVAVAANGDAVAVWEQRDDSATGRDIYANRLTSGVWSGAELVETAGGTAREPQVAVDPNGDAVVVWEQLNNVYANLLTSGVWGVAPQLLGVSADSPHVAVGGGGHAVAAWRQLENSLYNLYANQLTSGAWGVRALLEVNDAADAYRPLVAVDPTGDALVTWSQRIAFNDRRDAYANRLTSGSWDGPQLIETIDSGHASVSDVAIDANGHAVVMWWLLEDSPYSVYATDATPAP